MRVRITPGVAVGLVIAVLAVVVLVVSRPGLAPGSSASPDAGSPGMSGLPGLPPSPVVGVVVLVDSTGLDEVQSFTIRADDGRQWEFRVGVLENPTAFPPSHLAEHRATTVPVRVFFTFDGSELIAHRIEDAE